MIGFTAGASRPKDQLRLQVWAAQVFRAGTTSPLACCSPCLVILCRSSGGAGIGCTALMLLVRSLILSVLSLFLFLLDDVLLLEGADMGDVASC